MQFKTEKNTLTAGKEILVTKEDLHGEISKLEKEMTRLEIKIESTKSEIIKWMFIFWISQIGVTTGIIFAMLKLYLNKISRTIILLKVSCP